MLNINKTQISKKKIFGTVTPRYSQSLQIFRIISQNFLSYDFNTRVGTGVMGVLRQILARVDDAYEFFIISLYRVLFSLLCLYTPIGPHMVYGEWGLIFFII